MQSSPRTKPQSRTKLWFLVHSWLAMPVWFFVFFVCLTGSIATISNEIVWLADSTVRANPPANATRVLNYDEILTAIKNDHPEVYVERISRPVKSQFALSASVSYPDSTRATVYVNPYTGEIQGKSTGFNFPQFIRAIHGWLLLPFNNGFTIFSFGWYLVSFLGIPMLLSLVTGLMVYKRFWRGFFSPRLRFDRGARVFWGDFHRLAGIWSIPFIFIISITSIWFLTQAFLADNSVTLSTDGPPVYIERESIPVTDSKAPLIVTPEQAALAVSKEYPDAQVTRVSMPGSAFNHYFITGRSSSYPLLFETFYVNPYTGEIDKARRLSDFSGLELFYKSMRPLHTGDFVGLTLKLVYFFFGVLLTMMVFSGMLIWTKRTFKTSNTLIRARRMKRRRAANPLPNMASDGGSAS